MFTCPATLRRRGSAQISRRAPKRARQMCASPCGHPGGSPIPSRRRRPLSPRGVRSTTRGGTSMADRVLSRGQARKTYSGGCPALPSQHTIRAEPIQTTGQDRGRYHRRGDLRLARAFPESPLADARRSPSAGLHSLVKACVPGRMHPDAISKCGEEPGVPSIKVSPTCRWPIHPLRCAAPRLESNYTTSDTSVHALPCIYAAAAVQSSERPAELAVRLGRLFAE
ncbi:hypothetical protein C2E23DRAFT_399572 [Lenzites betulinus]|nr:hypothetical protein C2E23DRAFT_399572 [Lenzites betulinus]